MSLYEIESMMRSFRKLDDERGDGVMTPARMDELKSKWAALDLPDVRIN